MFSVFRSLQNPFLAPSRARAYEALGTFNPSVVGIGKDVHLFYRAMAEPDALRTPGRGFSTVGYSLSRKGGPFEGFQQVVSADQDWESYGCEDPRATFFEGKWYVFYTALGGYPFGPDNIKVAVAIGDEPNKLTEKHLVTPFNAKAATLFPDRINGEAVLIITAHTDWTAEHPRPTIAIARSKNVEDFWKPEFWNEWHAHLADYAFPDVRRHDTEHMEVGATPLLTEYGWLLVYSHIQNYYDEHNRIFGIEALLLDRDDPRHILAKTAFPFLVPEEFYERYGIVSNIAFPSGALLNDDTLTVYYGGADTVCASASMSFTHLLSYMQEDRRNAFVTRLNETPIMSPVAEHPWESVSVSNAAAVDTGDAVHLLYRAMGEDMISRLGYARLDDAVTVSERLPDPVYVPRIDAEKHGTEDPRLTQIEDELYLAYTAFDGELARGALSSIALKDFVGKKFTWAEPSLITPDTTNDKDISLLPHKVNGKTVILHRIDPNICLDFIEDFPKNKSIDQSIDLMTPRPGMWDGIKIGAAAPPIRVEEGWLFIYHAVGPDFHYRLGAALLDENLATVISRTASPIMEPLLPWEKEGVVNNVIFSCGIVLRDDTLYIYYGGADKSIGIATLSKKELVSRLLPQV
jgi:predicted GH43/DUF377 family glycosyl hydrolase